MTINPVADKLFDYLIKDLSGERFEAMVKHLFAAQIGDEFVPLGGMHDGGADGLLDIGVTVGRKTGTFFQFSVTDKDRAKTKISSTIVALIKAERHPKHLIYCTNQYLPKQDVLREDVFEKHQVLLTVTDLERLRQLVNSEPRPNQAFLHFFAADIVTIKHSAENLRGSINEFAKDPTVFAFLDYELKERFAQDHLQDRILDSLIYWALRDTDSDADKLMSQQQIADAINEVFPTAASVLIPQIGVRLSYLSKKVHGDAERIRHHKPKNLFCLPFALRKQLAERALEEAKLQDDFFASLKQRLVAQTKISLSCDMKEIGASLIFASIHDYFVEQGLILAAFLENKVEKVMISDQIVERQVERVLAKFKDTTRISSELVENALTVLRGVFYDPSSVERVYLGYLSRTSLLFMTLQKSPRMIEYFNQMAGNFRLFVGSDMLVKAMSEQQLEPERRQVENLLKACLGMGSKLVLTESVLEEVFTHLHAVDLEYRNHYLPTEAYLSPAVVFECDRIMIRAYYHSRFAGKRIAWESFLNQFLDVTDLRTKSVKGRVDLRGLLVQRFCMDYLSEEDLLTGVNQADVEELANKLADARGTAKNLILSKNDALMVHAIYRQRKSHKEQAIYDGFGYRTWWLTKETWVLNFTGALVAKEGGVPYIMRPEFILNFISLAPKAANVRKTFRDLLPTTVGLQLGQHLKPEVMHQLLSGTEEWASLTPERVNVIISEKVNRLKHDRLKRYLSNV